MRNVTRFSGLMSLLVSVASASQSEQFDLSGVPQPPTSFEEQQLLDLVAGFQSGDLAGARQIQRKLAAYYRKKGDLERAQKMDALLAENTAPATSTSEAQTTSVGGTTNNSATLTTTPSEQAISVVQTGGLVGKFYRQLSQGVMQQWQFGPDGRYLSTSITRGSGTATRSSERGFFRVDGNHLQLQTQQSTTAFVTAGVGGRDTQLGSGQDQNTVITTLTFRWLGKTPDDGIEIDGQRYQVQHW